MDKLIIFIIIFIVLWIIGIITAIVFITGSKAKDEIKKCANKCGLDGENNCGIDACGNFGGCGVCGKNSTCVVSGTRSVCNKNGPWNTDTKTNCITVEVEVDDDIYCDYKDGIIANDIAFVRDLGLGKPQIVLNTDIGSDKVTFKTGRGTTYFMYKKPTGGYDVARKNDTDGGPWNTQPAYFYYNQLTEKYTILIDTNSPHKIKNTTTNPF